MRFGRRDLLMAGASALAHGCISEDSGAVRVRRKVAFTSRPALAPLRLSEDRLIRITVCTRPFRGAGPRLTTETRSGKRIVHNYGHGGSGWSLSWGCAKEAAELALRDGAKSVAVIGAGAIGLTTALRLIETGAAVTIYARDFPAETRSARATGVWSPSSRIGLSDAVGEDFLPRWERWSRDAYAVHQHYIGTVGRPVEFVPFYSLRDEATSDNPPANRSFLHLDRRLEDLTPPWRRISSHEHPFRAERGWKGLVMTFNVAAYSERLTRDFLLRGGRMIRRDFVDNSELLTLPPSVIVNCSGYGAKRLFEDQSLEPVRGQINWFAPQPEAQYGLFYRNVSALSRRDGLLVQSTGPNDDYGFGDDSELADRTEMTNAIETLAPLFK